MRTDEEIIDTYLNPPAQPAEPQTPSNATEFENWYDSDPDAGDLFSAEFLREEAEAVWKLIMADPRLSAKVLDALNEFLYERSK